MGVNAIDLCLVADVNLWLGNPNPGPDDALIQRVITAFSQYVLNRTSRGADLYSSASASERYNGNGSDRLMVRRYPVTAVASLTVNNQPVTLSPDGVQAGFVIDTAGSQNSIVLVGGGGAFSGSYTQMGFGVGICRFAEGTQNIAITYTAGFATVPYDLNQAAISIVATNYRKKNWLGQGSQMQPGVGTTSYRKFEMSEEDDAIISRYERKFLD